MCNPIDNAAGREDSDAEEMGAENSIDVKDVIVVLICFCYPFPT